MSLADRIVGHIEPMDNPGPGNVDPRAAQDYSPGYRGSWMTRKLIRNRGDSAKALTPPPSLIRSLGQAEPILRTPRRPPG